MNAKGAGGTLNFAMVESANGQYVILMVGVMVRTRADGYGSSLLLCNYIDVIGYYRHSRGRLLLTLSIRFEICFFQKLV